MLKSQVVVDSIGCDNGVRSVMGKSSSILKRGRVGTWGLEYSVCSFLYVHKSNTLLWLILVCQFLDLSQNCQRGQ